jgi:V/A-type H+-transporting ATPase subunit E
MSLLAILEAIRASGDAQVRQVEEHANHQIYALRKNALLEAEKVAEETFSASVAPAMRERSRIIHRARLEAMQITGNEREVLVDAALEQTRGHMEGLRNDVSYPAVLQRLTKEALHELEGSHENLERVQLNVDPRDHALIERILLDMDLNLEIVSNLKSWGGLIAQSQDNRVVVINTLEARLERAIPFLRQYLANLFENENLENKLTKIVEMAIAS